MRGLHGCDDAEIVEALEGAGRDDLRVLDAEAEFAGSVGLGVAGIGSGHDGVGRELALRIVLVAFAEEVGLRDAGLLGGLECVEGHVVGAVADGVEAELEAGSGARGGHLVEVVLLVARDAGVGGLVVVRSFHGGGAGAERAVHEAFEHAEVEQRDR